MLEKTWLFERIAPPIVWLCRGGVLPSRYPSEEITDVWNGQTAEETLFELFTNVLREQNVDREKKAENFLNAFFKSYSKYGSYLTRLLFIILRLSTMLLWDIILLKSYDKKWNVLCCQEYLFVGQNNAEFKSPVSVQGLE